MQVTNRKVRDGAYTTYTLEAVIENQRIVAQHIIPTMRMLRSTSRMRTT